MTNVADCLPYVSSFVAETGLSDYDRLIKSHILRLKSKTIVTLNGWTSKNLLIISKTQIFLLGQMIIMKITQL